MPQGQRIELSDMDAEVLTLTPDHRPLKVSFTFSKPLEAVLDSVLPEMVDCGPDQGRSEVFSQVRTPSWAARWHFWMDTR
jgi:hypothetical protein